MAIEEIVATVSDDFLAVDHLIKEQLGSNIPFIAKVGEYITNSGGKRIRPLVTLLSAKACGYPGGKGHVTIAAVVEFLHTATLLHDDVVDGSHLRRGKATVNAVWGNSPSILVGDFLISRAFQMVVSLHNIPVLEVLSNATNLIAEGEVLQLLNCHNPETTEESYFEVIRLKTAKMFEAAAECGALIADADSQTVQALAQYALHLGNAFQLVDDVLDYTGDPKAMGKNVGDDLAEGKPTLPLIYAIKNSSEADANKIKKAITQPAKQTQEQSKQNQPDSEPHDRTAEIIKIVHDSGAIAHVMQRARDESTAAIKQLQRLPGSPYKEALSQLAIISISRLN